MDVLERDFLTKINGLRKYLGVYFRDNISGLAISVQDLQFTVLAVPSFMDKKMDA